MTPDPEDLAAYHARPGQSLYEHLHGVATNAERLLPAGCETAYGDEWETVMQALSWTHDAGKLMMYFQQYLETGDRDHADRVEYTYHSFVSALLALHSLHALDVSSEARTAGFYAVLKHHNVLPTLTMEHGDYGGPMPQVASNYIAPQAQLQDIDATAQAAAETVLQIASQETLSWSAVPVDSPEEYHALLRDPGDCGDRFYETVLRAWSTLVCADKLDAAGLTVPESPSRPALESLRERVDELPTGDTDRMQRLNQLRNTAHAEAYTRLCDRHAAGDRFFRLTLPTGFGKTLTGLRAGLELAEQRDSRLIYALPYTSILDQVDGVCQEFLDVSPMDPAYTVHHHLADTRTDLSTLRDSDAVSDGSETLYAETWQSGLVLTTFTQLFESLAGPGNTQSMKLPALHDSIIILDEPQGISMDWWDLVGRLTDFVTREYDATVVLMTATQPKLLERTPELPDPTPLTNQTAACEAFIQRHPRVEFELHDSLRNHLAREETAPETVRFDEAAEELHAATRSGSNTLAIVNTIESAATLTEALQRSAPGDALPLGAALCSFLQERDHADTDPETLATAYLSYLDQQSEVDADTTLVTTLTTRLRPRDRRILIAAVRQLLNNSVTTPFDDCPSITVSTQLIEAGVDVSFDTLYRDFGPLPAFVQAAGRCNREYEGDVSTVTIWRLAAPQSDGAVPSDLIYGRKSLLRPTRQALRTLQAGSDESISEATMISTGVDEYYDRLHEQRQTETREDSLTACFNSGDGDRLRTASLIDQEYTTQDFAVLVSGADKTQHQAYSHHRDEANWQEAKAAFTDLQSLVVTVPVDAETDADDEPVLRVADVTDNTSLYDVTTGRGLQYEELAFDLER